MNGKHVVLTGAAGFLGRGLYKAFEPDCHVRLVDVQDFESPHEKRIGDVADPDFCMKAVEGMDYLVIAHIFPRQNGYDVPYGAFHANVTGTANLLHAASRQGLTRVCLISSVDAVAGRPEGTPMTPGHRPTAKNVYSATKACQEITAEAFHRQFGLKVAIMRIGYVVDWETMTDKYGTTLAKREPGMIDRADCGQAVRRALELPDLSCQVFYIYSVSRIPDFEEGFAAYDQLNWHPNGSH